MPKLRDYMMLGKAKKIWVVTKKIKSTRISEIRPNLSGDLQHLHQKKPLS